MQAGSTLVRVLALGGALAIALAAPAISAADQEPPPRYDGAALRQAFAFYLGEWMPSADDPLVARRPELAGMVAFAYDWGAGESLLRLYEGLPAGDRDKAMLEGTIAWNPVGGTIDFQAVNTRWGFLFRGTYEALGRDRLQRTYDVYYPEVRELIPEPDMDGWVRRFREVMTPDGENAFDSTVEIWKDERWQPWGAGSFRMLRKAAREADLPSPYAPLAWLIGRWQATFTPEEGAPQPRMEFAWSEGKRHIVYRGWRPKGEGLVPEYEGMIAWQGDEEKLIFLVTYSGEGALLTETGDIELLDGGAVRLHMRVHYSEGRTLPWSDGAVAGPGGHTLEFLRTFTPDGPDGMVGTFVMKRGGVWEPPHFGPGMPTDGFPWKRIPSEA